MAILKHNHPSFTAIKEKWENLKSNFHELDSEKIEMLNKNKASQKYDIPIIIIDENADIFADFLAEFLNSAIKTFLIEIFLTVWS